MSWAAGHCAPEKGSLFRGQVRRGRAEVTLSVLDAAGNPVSGIVSIDTGFNGDLTLQRADIEQLGLAPSGTAQMVTATGQTVEFTAYGATVIWHNGPKQVRVLEAETTPMIGAGLLWDSRLSIDFALGGAVVISELLAG